MLAISLTQLNLININQEEQEIWKTHSSGYEVSSFGRVKGKVKEYLSPNLYRNGYLTVQLSFNKTAKTYLLHRLVAEVFIGEPLKDKYFVNHKNGNKTDCRLSNLEYVSAKENSLHAVGAGLIKSGEKHLSAKLTESQVKDIYERIKNGEKLKDIAKFYGVVHGAIGNIRSGSTWKSLYKDSGIVFNPKRRKKKTIFSENTIKRIFELKKNGTTVKEIASLIKVSPSVISEVFNNSIEYHLNNINNTRFVDFNKIISLDGESWKRHNCGLYFSDMGRVIGHRGKILKPSLIHGYLSIRYKGKIISVHKAVVECFTGKVKKGLVINHINGTTTDNKLPNLEIATPSENSLHAIRIGLAKVRSGEDSNVSKLKEHEVKNVYEDLIKGISIKEVSKKYRISKNYVLYLKSGRNWAYLWNSNKEIQEFYLNNLPRRRIKINQK